MAAVQDRSGAVRAAGTLFGHPHGVYLLFLAEMWERFSYYGMRALLILYLVGHWHMADARATAIYGAYTALVYGAAVVGGLLADRWLGLRRCMLAGGTLIFLGHLTLAGGDWLGGPGGDAEHLFLLALALIVAGTGLFKPAISAQVGALYGDNDPKRAGGYYIYYVGINTGAAAAPLACGYVGETFGWSYGFALAAAGMALGLVCLLAGRRLLPDPLAPTPSRQLTWATIGIPPLVVIAAWRLLETPDAVGWVLAATLVGALAVLFRYAVGATPGERRRIVAALILILAATVFWSLFEQGGSSLNLFAARAVDLKVGGLTLLPAQTQFFNPAFILLGAPVAAALWRALAARGRDPSPPVKFALGLAQAAAGFGVLWLGAVLCAAAGKTPLGWLVLAYFLHTTGELCLSTPGYATMAGLAPKRVSTLIMGLWLFALAAGNFIGAKIAALTAQPSPLGPPDMSIYSRVFGEVALVALGATGILLAIAPLLKRMMRPD